jgi:hypothetical protein
MRTASSIALLLVLGCGGKNGSGADADAGPDASPDVPAEVTTDPDASVDPDPEPVVDAVPDADDPTGDGDAPDDPDEEEVVEGFLLELPLVDLAATRTVVMGLGGSVTGGTFSTSGWTTTSRGDIIIVPLPAGIDASHGRIVFSVSDFEWDLTTEFWEAWILVSLDEVGFPFRPTPTGQAGVQSLYQGFNPDDSTLGYRPVAYFNLHDAGCTDWHDCTGETRTPSFWLRDDGTVYTLTHEWDGPVDRVAFSGTATVNRTVDLSGTSPGGEIAAGQLYLMINACGSSSANTCGPWGGPSTLKGGPVGVTYSALTLELYAD